MTNESELKAQAPTGQPEAEGWYYSSVAQWMPEYSTEKINNYDGPFPTWQKALEALFNEVGNDMDSFRADLKRMQAQLAASLEREAALREALEGCIADCSLSAIYVGDFYRDATRRVKHRAAEALAAAIAEKE